jgi:hypothetical protein
MLPSAWHDLVEKINGRPGAFGFSGVRDPENPCDHYDARGYSGHGNCLSDGHYECTGCSHLSPEAPRFQSRDGRGDRLRLFWARAR